VWHDGGRLSRLRLCTTRLSRSPSPDASTSSLHCAHTRSHAQAMDLELDGSGFGLGKRSRRYAAVIEDGVVRGVCCSLCWGRSGGWSRSVAQWLGGQWLCGVRAHQLVRCASPAALWLPQNSGPLTSDHEAGAGGGRRPHLQSCGEHPVARVRRRGAVEASTPGLKRSCSLCEDINACSGVVVAQHHAVVAKQPAVGWLAPRETAPAVQ
jgi:hypothetical protein